MHLGVIVSITDKKQISRPNTFEQWRNELKRVNKVKRENCVELYCSCRCRRRRVLHLPYSYSHILHNFFCGLLINCFRSLSHSLTLENKSIACFVPFTGFSLAPLWRLCSSASKITLQAFTNNIASLYTKTHKVHIHISFDSALT